MQKEKDIKELDWDVIMTAYQDGEPFEDIAAANGLTVRSLADTMRKVAGVVDPDVPLNEREKKYEYCVVCRIINFTSYLVYLWFTNTSRSW